MDRRTLNRALGVALVVAVSLNIAGIGPKARPNFEYFPNMVRTARYNAFEENPNFSDGMTLMPASSACLPPRSLPAAASSRAATPERRG